MKSDKKLFSGTAGYYVRYRPKYPAEFFDFLRGYFKLDRTARVLDLGCGTGNVAIPLSKDCKEVIGLDPEQEMLDEAVRLTEKAQIRNITWVKGRAEDLSEDLGIFRLTTFGESFHWMEQEKVLEKVYAQTEKGGGVAIATPAGRVWKYVEGEEAWKTAYKTLVRKYLGEERLAGNSVFSPPVDFEDTLDESPFGSGKLWTHDYVRNWTVESIIGFLYSTSFASKRLFGNRVPDFEEELKEELLRIDPSGNFTEKVTLEALVAKK